MKMSRLHVFFFVVFSALFSGPVLSYDRYGYDDYRVHGDRREYRYRCHSCGYVARIEYERGRRGHGGAVAGAIIGGAIGNQIGSGDGRRAATVAGAVIGGIAGDRRSSQRRNFYDILVEMDNGRRIWVTQRELRGVREGSRVEVRNGRVRLRYS
jgi:outer membrane lipoprotein SlyB